MPDDNNECFIILLTKQYNKHFVNCMPFNLKIYTYIITLFVELNDVEPVMMEIQIINNISKMPSCLGPTM